MGLVRVGVRVGVRVRVGVGVRVRIRIRVGVRVRVAGEQDYHWWPGKQLHTHYTHMFCSIEEEVFLWRL